MQVPGRAQRSCTDSGNSRHDGHSNYPRLDHGARNRRPLAAAATRQLRALGLEHGSPLQGALTKKLIPSQNLCGINDVERISSEGRLS